MESISDILLAVRDGKLSVKKAENYLKLNTIAFVGDYARLDYNRFLRRGVPEIVYAQNKTVPQLASIVRRLIRIRMENPKINVPIILSRVSSTKANQLMKSFASFELRGKKTLQIKYYPEASIVAVARAEKALSSFEAGRVALLAAGTSDLPALNESEIILNLLGCRTIRFNDVGVAGLHRLLEPLRRIQDFDPDAIIVAAGMEGALPSVIAGLSSVPVIGLPTSVGYGYGRDGEAALMSMLQACSLGVSVVNIDSGVAAGIVAWLISSRTHSRTNSKVNAREITKRLAN